MASFATYRHNFYLSAIFNPTVIKKKKKKGSMSTLQMIHNNCAWFASILSLHKKVLEITIRNWCVGFLIWLCTNAIQHICSYRAKTWTKSKNLGVCIFGIGKMGWTTLCTLCTHVQLFVLHCTTTWHLPGLSRFFLFFVLL